MKKYLYITLIFFALCNCSFNKVVKHHGVPLLEKKQDKIIVNTSNKNDIISLLGYPSTKSHFDNDIWIYIERKQTQSEFKNLGRDKIFKNDVLVLEIDKYGILKKKDFYTMENMKELNVAKNETKGSFRKKSFVYDFLSSLRQKINDPLGQRAKKRKELNRQ